MNVRDSTPPIQDEMRRGRQIKALDAKRGTAQRPCPHFDQFEADDYFPPFFASIAA